MCPSSGTPLFDTIPIDPSEFLAFRPLGFLSPPIHMFPAKHSAFSMTPPGATPRPVPVRAPGRVWVKEVWEASFSSGARNYQVYLYPCTDVRVYFGHLATVTDAVLNAMRDSPASCNSFADGTGTVTTCRHQNLSLMLESGEPFATGPDSAGVDLGVVDFRGPPASFVRLDHYDYYYPLWSAPLDYFTTDVRQTLASKTGHVFGTRPRTAAPVGGTHMQDIPGAAQGNWFLPGAYWSNSTDLSRFLGLSSDYVDPSQPMMAIGTSVRGVNMGLYSFSPAAQGLINRPFNAIRSDGNTYCVDGFLRGQSTGGMPLTQANGVLLLTMPSDSTLQLELVSGNSCATAARVFTANATTFER